MLISTWRVLCAALLALAVITPDAWGQQAPIETRQEARPRVALVLSGGGARGLAHVGVLQVLEQQRIPVDIVVGTSMGAVIGGLFASGMKPAEIERELLAVRWNELFSPRVSRQELSQRRKEQDFELSPVLELGWRDGELRAPQAAVSSRGLESLLRRYTLPVRDVRRFDDLPIPFRAVATDMENGAAVELTQGDLAEALRSSISIPGVFAPIERDGRVMGDGGLVDNLPVDLARRMGADIVIAVNVGTPLAGRETFSSVIGLTAQMINILTEQNVQRSLAALRERDVLISPILGTLTSGDFEQSARFIQLGREAGASALARLQALTLAPSAFAEWQQRHRPPEARPVNLAFVAFEGTTATYPRRLEQQLESRAGDAFDAAKAERDTRRLAARGDYVRADYRVERTPAGEGLVFDLDDKPWGPNLLQIGLDLSTNFAGRSLVNLKLSHERHWLTPNGTEWRNRLNLGDAPLVATEIYHPLRWAERLDKDWFISGWLAAERRRQSVFGAGGQELGQFNRTEVRVGADIGQPWAAFGEIRLGLQRESRRISPQLVDVSYTGPTAPSLEHENGLRVRAVVDQLDYALFPQAGFRVEAAGILGERRQDRIREPFHRVQVNATAAISFGTHTVNAFVLADVGDEPRLLPLAGRRSLGGFHLMSGYLPGQISGNQLLFGRLTWYSRLQSTAGLTRGLFLGGSLEAGNAWLQRSDASLRDLRSSASLFLGADTVVGPMYLALTGAPRGTTGVVFFIGRP